MANKITVSSSFYSTESLAEGAYQAIRDKILRGYYPLGAALSRRQLAKELRMSFLPVTQALQHLEIDGLVESKPRVGTRVRVPTREDVLERYGLREALETQAARLCAEHADQASREELMKMGFHLDQLYASSSGSDEDFLYSVHTYHMRFHLRVAEIGGNSLLRGAIEREQVLVFNWLFDTAAQQRTLPANFHSELAAALTGSTIEAADAAMRAHIRYGVERILEAMQTPRSENGWRVLRKSSIRDTANGRSRQAVGVK
jgi:GntR family transcriptional regulator, rspAB operon transcriptional repressor